MPSPRRRRRRPPRAAAAAAPAIDVTARALSVTDGGAEVATNERGATAVKAAETDDGHAACGLSVPAARTVPQTDS